MLLVTASYSYSLRLLNSGEGTKKKSTKTTRCSLSLSLAPSSHYTPSLSLLSLPLLSLLIHTTAKKINENKKESTDLITLF